MVGLTAFGAFKGHMFPKMRYTVLLGRLIPTTYVENDATMQNFSIGYFFMNYPDAVVKGENINVLHIYQFAKLSRFIHDFIKL